MTRYAIYFAPEQGSALEQFGWSWLGRSPESPHLIQLSEIHAAWVEEPRRYGFHATLKAPFRLADGQDEASLMAAMADFAAGRSPFTVKRLVLRELGGFVALCPGVRDDGLNALANDCVREFDKFRAPPSEAELARRLGAELSPRQREHLRLWGYPYVFEDFRFHMTLTGRLGDAARGAAIAAMDPPLNEPLRVASLCLFVQPEADGLFTLSRRFAFTC